MVAHYCEWQSLPGRPCSCLLTWARWGASLGQSPWLSPLPSCSQEPEPPPALNAGRPHQRLQSGRQRAVQMRGLPLQATGKPDALKLGLVLHVDALCREGGCGQDQGPVRTPPGVGAQLSQPKLPRVQASPTSGVTDFLAFPE